MVVTDDGPVRIVTIDRPSRRNAVDRVTADALDWTFREFEAARELGSGGSEQSFRSVDPGAGVHRFAERDR